MRGYYNGLYSHMKCSTDNKTQNKRSLFTVNNQDHSINRKEGIEGPARRIRSTNFVRRLSVSCSHVGRPRNDWSAVHPLNLGGSNCQTTALSESLNISPQRHQDSRKNRGKKIPLRNFCKTTFAGGQ